MSDSKPEKDEIDRELDELFADEMMKAGGSKICSVVAAWTFEAMKRAERTSEPDEIDRELDEMLTYEVREAGGNEIGVLLAYGEDPNEVAVLAFEAMWRAIRTSQKKANDE
jgi:hypothetical protein